MKKRQQGLVETFLTALPIELRSHKLRAGTEKTRTSNTSVCYVVPTAFAELLIVIFEIYWGEFQSS